MKESTVKIMSRRIKAIVTLLMVMAWCGAFGQSTMYTIKERDIINSRNSSSHYNKGLIAFDKKDKKGAYREFALAMKEYPAGASYYLGLCYMFGFGTEPNMEKAFELFEKGCDETNIEHWDDSYYYMGACYQNGWGTKKDIRKAVRCYKKATGWNDATGKFDETDRYPLWDAYYALGLCYECGEGVEKDKDKAKACYTKGHASAGYSYGNKFYTALNRIGAIMLTDYELNQLKSKAAYDVEKQFELGRRYAEGDGVPQNYYEAVKWYQKAADNNHAGAINNLGVCYGSGNGVTKNYDKALELYRKSANLGNATAQSNIGLYYEYGYGVTQDYDKAKEWYEMALRNGYEKAKDGLKRIEGLTGLPPNLFVENTIFEDNGNNNNAIDANETNYLTFFIKNKGKGWARDCYVRTDMSGNTSGITFDGFKMSEIEPGGEFKMKIPIKSNRQTKDGKVTLKFYIDDPKGGGTKPQSTVVNTKAFVSPRIVVQDYLASSNTGKIVQKERFDVKILIQNIEYGTAEDVEIEVIFPKEVNRMDEIPTKIDIPRMSAGDTTMLSYSMWASLNSEPIIPIKVVIREKYGEYGDEKIIELPIEEALEVRTIAIKEVQRDKDNKGPVKEIKLGKDIVDVDVNVPIGINTKNDNTFVLIIANENYDEKLGNKVDYAINDGKVFKEYCTKTLGIEDSHIRIVEDASLSNINVKIDWLERSANNYDGEARIIFYYAGHCHPEKGSAFLMPVDAELESIEKTAYKVSDLYSKMGQMKVKSSIVFLDACFSGQNRGGGINQIASRGIKIHVEEGVPSGSTVVLSAAKSDQKSLPYDKMKHGMFTYFLLKKLQDTKGNVTIKELSDYVIKKVTQESNNINNIQQTPEVTHSADAHGWENWNMNGKIGNGKTASKK